MRAGKGRKAAAAEAEAEAEGKFQAWSVNPVTGARERVSLRVGGAVGVEG